MTFTGDKGKRVQNGPFVPLKLNVNLIEHYLSRSPTFRWKSGVASSLNYITISDDKSPIFHPYPSWELNTLPGSEPTPSSSESTGKQI